MTQVDEGPESPGGDPNLMTFGTSQVGEILADRYELTEHINEDAWGRQVWRGLDVLLRRPVAVVLRYPGGESATEMLSAAVATSRVMHPHLVGVYDAADEGDRAYVVREWVDGRALRDEVAEGPLDAVRATAVAHAVADAVAALHGSGIAHGNIHPGTVLIGNDGRVVLADARADEAATAEADVRAIGAVLYAALTGRWPQAEAGPTRLPDATRDHAGHPVAPRQVRAGVPDQLSELTTDLLNPISTAPSADVLAADLDRMDVDPSDQMLGGDAFDLGEFVPAAPQEPARRKGRKIIVGVAGLLVIALIGLFVGTQWMAGGSSGNSPQGGTSGPAASGVPKPAPKGQPTQLNLAADQVRIVDPPQTDRSELDGADRAVDGDLSTAWKTDHYNTANFGNRKPGMGLLIDLGQKRDVSSVTVAMASPGATVAIWRINQDPGVGSSGDAFLASAKGHEQIGESSSGDSGPTLSFPVGQQARYLVVWISTLPEVEPVSGLRYQAAVQEVKVFVTQ